MSDLKLKVKDFFRELNMDTMHLVDDFYAEQVLFEDPLGEKKGSTELKDYYQKLYNNVTFIEFKFTTEVLEGYEYTGAWIMTMQAKGFNGGKQMSIKGISLIKFDPATNKAIYHRDYFDLGEFVYEWIPILGGMVKFVKHKMETQR